MNQKILALKVAALCSLLTLANPSFAQTMVVTYQGRVLDNGTTFTGTGQFKFALVTSTDISSQATAIVTGGAVTAISVNSTGSGYTSLPTVTIAPPPDNISFDTYWSNDGTSVNGSEPAAAVSVGVSNGLFHSGLGRYERNEHDSPERYGLQQSEPAI